MQQWRCNTEGPDLRAALAAENVDNTAHTA